MSITPRPMNIFSKLKSKNDQVSERDRVPTKEKAAYGAGGIANGIQETADNGLLNPVFVVTMGISPTVMSLCGLFYRAWDAITDLLMGYISDNTRTRWGRRRPYIFGGAILMAMVMPFIFMFDPGWSLSTIILWMIGFQLILTLTNTIYNIPYQSLLIEITSDSNERTSVAAWRAYFGISTQFMVAWVWWLTQRPIFHRNDDVDILYGAQWVISGFAILVLILGIMPAIFTRERFYKNAVSQAKVSLKSSIKNTFTNKPFLYLIAFVVLFTIGMNANNGLAFYTQLYYVSGGDQGLASSVKGWEGTLRIFTTLAGIPLFHWISKRKSKRYALTLAVMITFLSSISTLVFYTPNYPYLSIVPVLFLAATISAIWVLIPSMVGDIVDDDELNNGERREGSFASVFSWVLKMAFTLAAALSGPLVELAGFRTAIRHDLPDDVLWNMRMLLVFIPAILIGSSFFFLSRYPITNERIRGTREKLEGRRGSV